MTSNMSCDKTINFFGPPTLIGHSFAAPYTMMMKSSSFESPKSYLYAHNLKDNKAAPLKFIIPIRSTPILYHKLPKSPAFLQATVHFIQSQHQCDDNCGILQ